MRFPVFSYRPLLMVAASAAIGLASCGGAGVDDVDPTGAASTTAPAETTGPGQGEVSDTDPDEVTPDDPDVSDPEVVAPRVPSHPPAPEPAPAFDLSADEMLPEAKRLAADAIQALLTYEPRDTAEEVAGRIVDPGREPALVVAAGPLLKVGSWSRAEIVYPQLGGFTDTSASVMVVARQSVGFPNGEIRKETRTLDVRLAIEDGEWVFDELASSGGRAIDRPDELSEAAVGVVDDDRIELPDTARWDIYRGDVEEPILELMAVMAERAEYGVVVLDTGHPWEVFGTDRQSRHSLGRAVDVYRVGGTNVIDDRGEGSETHDFVQWLYDQPEMTNMGAPWALDDFGGRSFSDDLHQDHLHIEAAAGE